jgi:glycosyltransferase involved in cell wall biosynthesis
MAFGKPSVSVVITTFNRPQLLRTTLESFVTQVFEDYEVVVIDDGSDAETPALCNAACCPNRRPIRYFKLNRDRTQGYNNPARPNNAGIRQAQGDIIILQNAEVKHGANQEVIQRMSQLVGTSNAVFSQVEALNEYGMGKDWYVHPVNNPRPFFFCGALRKDIFEGLRGFDEDYQYYGFDDNDFADRLKSIGIKFDFTDIQTQHQWHPSSYDAADPHNAIPALTYHRKTNEMKAGTITAVRNLGREWGAL